jgi:hypothetical protein
VGERVDAAQHLVARVDRESNFLGSHLVGSFAFVTLTPGAE